jgi:hypothetical protein
MNSLTIDHLIRAAHLFEQQNVLQLGLSTRGVEIDERLSKMAFTTTTYNPPAALSGYCTPYSGNSSTSSLRSSPTNSMLSSGPTSPLHHHHVSSSTSTSQPSGIIKKSKSSHSTKQSRAAHNELEKNRRANLRSYLDQIKAILPPEYDSTRDTTLSLLTRARNHLRILGHRKNEMLCRRNDIVTENAKLKERIEKARAMRNAKRCRKQDEQQQQNVHEECTPTVTPMITSRNGSPIFLEYSPSTKPPQLFIPSPTDRMVTIDPYLEGLLPPVPLSYPYLHQMQANRAAMV